MEPQVLMVALVTSLSMRLASSVTSRPLKRSVTTSILSLPEASGLRKGFPEGGRV